MLLHVRGQAAFCRHNAAGSCLQACAQATGDSPRTPTRSARGTMRGDRAHDGQAARGPISNDPRTHQGPRRRERASAAHACGGSRWRLRGVGRDADCSGGAPDSWPGQVVLPSGRPVPCRADWGRISAAAERAGVATGYRVAGRRSQLRHQTAHVPRQGTRAAGAGQVQLQGQRPARPESAQRPECSRRSGAALSKRAPTGRGRCALSAGLPPRG